MIWSVEIFLYCCIGFKGGFELDVDIFIDLDCGEMLWCILILDKEFI